MTEIEDDLRSILVDSANAFLTSGRDMTAQALWQGMAEQGWAAMLISDALGGAEMPLGYAAELMEQMGAHVCAAPLMTGALVPSVLLQQFGDTRRAGQLLEKIAADAVQMPVAWQEQAGQIQLDDPATRLAAGRLTGRKVFVPHASSAGLFLVCAQSDDGFALIAVPPDAEGLVVKTVELVDGSHAGTLEFADVQVPGENIVATGPAAQAAVRHAIDVAAVLLAAQLSGLARATLDNTVAYLHERSQFGQKLSAFQVLQHRVVDLYGTVRLANASWRNALRRLENAPDTPETKAAVHAAKARCSQVANDMAKSAIQLHGAFGFTAESRMGITLNCALAWSAALGNADAHRNAYYDIFEVQQ